MSERYDPRCLALADFFLESADRATDRAAANRAHRFAGAIQEFIEGWMEDEAMDELDEMDKERERERDDD